MRLRLRNQAPNLEPWMVAVPVGVVVVGGLAYAVTTLLVDLDGSLPPGVPEPAPVNGVPFAAGIRKPVWPVSTRHKKRGLVSYRDVNGNYHGNWSRRFGAPRDSRRHVGMDLYGFHGDPVLAMGDGVVTATQTFHLGTHAIFVDHGDTVVMYGEVAPKSWREFGVSKGTRVRKGDPIARVGCMVWDDDCESHMLHLETYVPGTTRNKRWYVGSGPPPQILDPTRLLLQASAR